MTPLPIDDALPGLLSALRAERRAVLQAPPGAGKTTRVPLALLDADLCPGRIVMLEPRRLAARAAAARMAESLGEEVGATVGFRIRGETRVSARTRIEVVTEGILTRMLQSDPSLPEVGAVIFDEFHERSLNADLGLALTWEVRNALRDDLLILVMSATLDAGPVAALLDAAPIITSEGRSFPVDIDWLPAPDKRPLDVAMTTRIREALDNGPSGDLLAFLPGQGEIQRLQRSLGAPPGVQVLPLYGALPYRDQRAALAPAAPGQRKVVLATAIAETSLTLPGVTAVVDAGLARRARYDPGSGMTRLVTERASRAEIAQRAGRAGRVAPGRCYRLWTKGAEGGLPAFAPPEIETADLTGLALDLAQWGARDPAELAFVTPPASGPFAEARRLLQTLDALDDSGAITAHGRAMAALPLHPRLAHMLLKSEDDATDLAALLSARDPLRNSGADLTLRLRALHGKAPTNANLATLAEIRNEAKRHRRLIARLSGTDSTPAAPRDPEAAAHAAAMAYPDRIALRRPGDAPRYLLSNGTGAELASDDSLAGQRHLVVTDTDGAPRDAKIRQALPISERALHDLFSDQIKRHHSTAWSRRDRKVIARIQDRLGALPLSDHPWHEAPPEEVAQALLTGLREIGLPAQPAFDRLRARLRIAGAQHPNPDALLENPDWLLPHLHGLTTPTEVAALNLHDALWTSIDYPDQQRLNAVAPPHYLTPLGRKIPIDYAQETPEISVRLQEMFGVTTHPRVGTTPLRITLLSPAGRPLQTTSDLPGFWRSSYTDVRKDMRGRYPKHPWPEDPTEAAPTARAKPR